MVVKINTGTAVFTFLFTSIVLDSYLYEWDRRSTLKQHTRARCYSYVHHLHQQL